jgi:hypothetical protein
LSDFPTIAHILNTKDLSSDLLVLIAFIRNPAASQALYAPLLSVNNVHTAAYDEITINQN